MQKFEINGKSYSSIDEMPSEIRQAYEMAMGIFADKNKNGMPDIMEGPLEMKVNSIQTPPVVLNTTKFFYEGKEYKSLSDLPPEAREKYERAMRKYGNLSANPVQTADEPKMNHTSSDFKSPSMNHTSNDFKSSSQTWTPTEVRDSSSGFVKILIVAGMVIIFVFSVLKIAGIIIPLPF